MSKKLTVAVAGASGFVGSALIKSLAEKHNVIALTRGKVEYKKDLETNSNITWRQCDLFSLLETENALENADIAVYLVHSMLPSAELSQGNFKDFDLLVADNFARAAKITNLKQIVYLGGMIPDSEKLSPHLESRKEVEVALSSTGVPLTVLRAAMIFGNSGSSTTLLLKLVKKLPLMICPSWTSVMTQPIALEDAVKSLVYVAGRKDSYDQSYDLAGPSKLSYKEMMLGVADSLNLKRYIYTVPVSTANLSSGWLSLITGAPLSLTKPLVSSLKHEMVPRPGHLLKIEGEEFKDFNTSIKEIVEGCNKILDSSPRAFVLPEDEKKYRMVRSVQRLVLPSGLSAEEVALEYMRWLPVFMKVLLKVEIGEKEDFIDFKIPIINISLLKLEFAKKRSQKNRQLFYVVGGVLARSEKKDRIEFRETYDKKNIIVAVHDFKPSIPWYVYKYTQAPIHAFVMKSFGKHLAKLVKKAD